LQCNHYKTLFNSVGYDVQSMKDIFAEVSLPDVNDIHAGTGSEVHQI